MKSLYKFYEESLEGLRFSKVRAGSKTPHRFKIKTLHYFRALTSRKPRVFNNTVVELACLAGVKTSI